MKNFITFYEVLSTCDLIKLENEIAKTYSECNKIEKRKWINKTFIFMGELLMLTPSKANSNKVLLFKESTHSIIYNNSFFVYYNDLEKIKCTFYSKKELNTKSLEQLKLISNKLSKLTNTITTYDYSYDSLKKIVSYIIPISLFKRYSKEKVVADILYELTFFGIILENNEKTKKEKKESIKSIIEEIKKEQNKIIKQKEQNTKQEKSKEQSIKIPTKEEIIKEKNNEIGSILDTYTEIKVLNIAAAAKEMEKSN